jgi:hypothetical protein
MRKIVAALSAGAFVCALSVPAFAKTETVKGQLVDESCYAKDMAGKKPGTKIAGEEAECAASCAKQGNQVALVTDDGKIYQVAGGLAANKNEKLVPHMAHTVEITGDVMEMGGKLMIHADTLKMVSK